MRKYLLHPFMTAFVAFPFNLLLEKQAKNCFAYIKVQILLLTSSGSVRPNQKILVRSTTTFLAEYTVCWVKKYKAVLSVVRL